MLIIDTVVELTGVLKVLEILMVIMICVVVVTITLLIGWIGLSIVGNIIGDMQKISRKRFRDKVSKNEEWRNWNW